MRIDWQAYLDGSLAAAEKKRADELLAGSDAARAEHEGLQAFRGAVKQAVLEQPAPQARLNELLSSVVVPDSRSLGGSARWVLAPLAAAMLLVLAWFGLNYDPMRLNTNFTVEKARAATAAEAQEWVQQNMFPDAPRVDFGELARMEMTRHGEDWACYDYVDSSGRKYYLYMKREGSALREGEAVERGGRVFYVGNGIGWEGRNFAFYLRGGDEDVRWQLAELAAEQTS